METTLLQLPKAYSEKEAAELLTSLGWDISTKTLAKARERGEITYRRFGGRIRYVEDDLRAFLERAVVHAVDPLPKEPRAARVPPVPTETDLEKEAYAASLLMSSFLRKPKKP